MHESMVSCSHNDWFLHQNKYNRTAKTHDYLTGAAVAKNDSTNMIGHITHVIYHMVLLLDYDHAILL